ncbi:GNAT family N-acetyltransferase [Microbacterium hydrocarbonoxydans]|uniref:GNAT family N-acetyltransferase n=1 Tax=Microbacterium hydrocarbonoxydans TaxID=273678 RepID=UPI00203AF463|nr:GNAT family N-acetyltransferase [Microbacterium hydrocarbonoxydans]MCM3780341.1 GNAT family N-acetyltransferase [Microbacterium hydrocarbonoxydans]
MPRLDADHVLRLVQPGDGAPLARAYTTNREHLASWEPVRNDEFYTAAWQERHVDQCVADVDSGRGYRFVLVSDDGEIRGRMNLNNVVRGAFRSADVGYWIDASRLRRGLAGRGVAELVRFAEQELSLHRLQAATLLDNVASQRVLNGARFTEIGLAPQYLHIAGEWRDHLLFQRILA